jgi:hypothetical protein
LTKNRNRSGNVVEDWGCDGTCVGVTGRTCAGEFRDNYYGIIDLKHLTGKMNVA